MVVWIRRACPTRNTCMGSQWCFVTFMAEKRWKEDKYNDVKKQTSGILRTVHSNRSSRSSFQLIRRCHLCVCTLRALRRSTDSVTFPVFTIIITIIYSSHAHVCSRWVLSAISKPSNTLHSMYVGHVLTDTYLSQSFYKVRFTRFCKLCTSHHRSFSNH